MHCHCKLSCSWTIVLILLACYSKHSPALDYYYCYSNSDFIVIVLFLDDDRKSKQAVLAAQSQLYDKFNVQLIHC